MIISNRYQGPRYSTDSTAHDLRRFVTTCATNVGSTLERHAGPATDFSFDQLYPSLSAGTAAPKTGIFAAVVRGFKAVALALHLGRGSIA